MSGGALTAFWAVLGGIRWCFGGVETGVGGAIGTGAFRFLGNGSLSRWRHHGHRVGGGLDYDLVFVVMVPVATADSVIFPKVVGLGVAGVEVALFAVGDDIGGFHRFRGAGECPEGVGQPSIAS